ncbi:MAG: ATP-dependent helicase [Propionibacteriaceae bacterium]|jgi:superfamily I DNA/RNA helicase|nr:ATP-dependent helicase [Propionibacteriaceae bacterium]
MTILAPSPTQRQLLAQWRGPTLALGAAGSGKTALCALAAAQVVSNGQVPLVLARSRQAASALKNQIASLLPGQAWQLQVATAHSFAVQAFHRWGEAAGFADAPAWRLLTAPEQEYRVRELLASMPEIWPEFLRQAVGTKSFAKRIRAVLQRVRQLGLDPGEVAEFGRQAGLPEWVAVGEFFEAYLDVLDAEMALDYAECTHRARLALAQAQAELPSLYQAVIVDDLSELDPAQLGLLYDLAAGLPVLATDNPQAAASTFRGAHPRAAQAFVSLFSPAVVELREAHRFASGLAMALGLVGSRLPVPVIGGAPRQLEPMAVAPGPAPSVLIAPTDTAQAEAVAALLQTAHSAGRRYREMAVLVRNTAQITTIVRYLAARGVPVQAPTGEIPLAQAPAVQPLLQGLRELLDAGEIPPDARPDALAWQFWDKTPWQAQLVAEAAEPGLPGLLANRDLDTLIEFFAFAGEVQEVGVKGVRSLLAQLEAQQIPADNVREDRPRRDAVAVLTVYRALGQQWPFVVLAGVQEESWPNLRRGGTLLNPDTLTSTGIGAPPTAGELLQAERRLFLSACACAAEELAVTASLGSIDGERQPSRFLAELGVDPLEHPPPGNDLPALVGDLRYRSTDSAPEAATAAANVLAVLAAGTDATGRPLAPGAHPDAWWGVREFPEAPAPRAPEDSAPARFQLSPSALSQLIECPRRYYLARQAHAEAPLGPAAAFGTLVHAVIEQGEQAVLAAGSLAPGLVVKLREELPAKLRAGWAELEYPARWLSVAGLQRAEAMLGRYLALEQARAAAGVELVAVEQEFEFQVPVSAVELVVKGKIDRLERTEAGLRVVDFKTGAPLSQGEVRYSDQLGVYQMGMGHAAVGEATAAGASMVFLKQGTAKGLATEYAQPPLTAEFDTGITGEQWLAERLEAAAMILAEGSYPASTNAHCTTCPFASSCPSQEAGRQLC